MLYSVQLQFNCQVEDEVGMAQSFLRDLITESLPLIELIATIRARMAIDTAARSICCYFNGLVSVYTDEMITDSMVVITLDEILRDPNVVLLEVYGVSFSLLPVIARYGHWLQFYIHDPKEDFGGLKTISMYEFAATLKQAAETIDFD